MKPVLTVVDYEAWEKGYMPPSEHVLIDKLAYRGARVVMSNWLGGDAQMWVVLEGTKPLTQRQRKLMRELMALMMDDDEAPAHPPKAAASENEDHQPREVQCEASASRWPVGGGAREEPEAV